MRKAGVGIRFRVRGLDENLALPCPPNLLEPLFTHVHRANDTYLFDLL